MLNKNRLMIVAVTGATLFISGCTHDQVPGHPSESAIETYSRGVYAYRDGRNDDATECLRATLEANPNLIMPRFMLGRIYKQKGDYLTASQYYESLVRMDPYEIDHRYQLGVSYQMLQRLQEAAKAYQGALKLNANDFGSNMNLGLVYLSMGEVDKAVKYTQTAVRIRPNSAEAQANLAVALDSDGEYQKAEVAYRKSLDLAPGQAGTLINFANNLISQGKSDDALEVLKQAIKMENTPYLHKRMGDAYAIGEKYDEAMIEYQLAIQINPKYYSALNEAGRVLIVQYQKGLELEESKRDSALGLWRQSMGINHNQPEIKSLLEQWEKRMFSK